MIRNDPESVTNLAQKRVFDYSTLSTSASDFSSQYVMPISRYIVVAVALYQTFGLVEDYSKSSPRNVAMTPPYFHDSSVRPGPRPPGQNAHRRGDRQHRHLPPVADRSTAPRLCHHAPPSVGARPPSVASRRFHPCDRGLCNHTYRRIGEWRHTADVYLAKHISILTGVVLRPEQKIAVP